MTEKGFTDTVIGLTGQIVSAYVSNNRLEADAVPEFIGKVHAALREVAEGGEGAVTRQRPAVPVKRSVTPSHIVCLEDGARLKMLKRHLRTHHGLTPEQYRAKWGLPASYPIVAPNYAARRSELAKEIGLSGRRGRRTKRRNTGPMAA